MSSSPVSVKVPHPFDGSRANLFQLNTFLQALNVQFVVKRVSNDTEKIDHLSINLTGSALNWFVTYSTNVEITDLTYAAFVEKFRNAHIGKLDTYNIIQKMSSMKQAHSIDAYITEFDNLRRLLPSGSLIEDMFIQLFVKGLKPNTRKELHLRPITSFYEATQLASRAENYLYSDGFSVGSSVAPGPFIFDADGDIVMTVCGSRGSRSSRFSSSSRSAFPSRNPDSNHWRQKYREVCMKQRLCFNCMSPNHQSAKCTQGSSSSSSHRSNNARPLQAHRY
ncbi:hypothetical protein TBLA_0B06840 [Henningerozyma blattae CBS 6284]|uniref:Ty3 transposon capsid-like protein domain-containing protein n=1 Tax=Henningerozyma blattae (strain ATCC 34711 / CBS 6284 / DSM 70876 / NBRC 10599 / NRRL Y-10934 / UCD 77-7) TaxID=1071380 RepID=I2GZF1_HENB6|nr:hypothetical protein TBLA_0B06840 [Tetrapisispora blattae CBS 6284]CCH59503.1 hypothetical protein TBLA_0B06840 [Tetrapisispora blattae CBS 6284]